MSAERDVTRVVRSWIRTDEHESADRILQTVLSRLDATPQRRSGWSAWRSYRMNTYAKLAAAAAAVLVVAVVGYQFLPRPGGPGGQPTVTPSPTPSLLAKGTFVAQSFNTTLDATGAGSDVSGSLRIATVGGGVMNVDLECERTIAGLLWIGGDITDTTANMSAQAGTRAAIVLKRGAPVEAVFIFQFDDPRSASCQAFFDDMLALGPVEGSLAPIEGSVELRP